MGSPQAVTCASGESSWGHRTTAPAVSSPRDHRGADCALPKSCPRAMGAAWEGEATGVLIVSRRGETTFASTGRVCHGKPLLWFGVRHQWPGGGKRCGLAAAHPSMGMYGRARVHALAGVRGQTEG